MAKQYKERMRTTTIIHIYIVYMTYGSINLVSCRLLGEDNENLLHEDEVRVNVVILPTQPLFAKVTL